MTVPLTVTASMEFEVQWTTSDQGDNAESLVAQFLRRLQQSAMSTRAIHARQQRGVRDRAPNLARDFRKLMQEQFAADRRLHDSVSRLAHRRRERLDLVEVRHRLGTGLPLYPTRVGDFEVAKPIAPASVAPRFGAVQTDRYGNAAL